MNIKELRKGEGVSLRTLSARTGITTANLYRFEAGKSDPRLSSVEAILDSLGYRLHVIEKPQRVKWVDNPQ